MKTSFLMGVFAVLLSGCLPKNAFSPPPHDYETWSKPGASELDIWKAMLDCGYASPFAAVEKFPGGDRSDKQIVESMLCLERSGYTHYVERRPTPVCSEWRMKTLACEPDAAIPLPDLNKRLNSGYCKKYPQSRACVP